MHKYPNYIVLLRKAWMGVVGFSRGDIRDADACLRANHTDPGITRQLN